MSSELVSADRIKLPFTYDADRMKAECDALNLHDYIYYSSVMLKLPQERKPSDPPTSYPYINSLIEDFHRKTKVTLARILRLEAGSEVREHCDPMLGLDVPDSVVRLTIPIHGQEGVRFLLNDTPVPMQLGECWYMKLSDTHRVLHQGSTERINLTLDMKPNAWLCGVLEEQLLAA